MPHSRHAILLSILAAALTGACGDPLTFSTPLAEEPLAPSPVMSHAERERLLVAVDDLARRVLPAIGDATALPLAAEIHALAGALRAEDDAGAVLSLARAGRLLSTLVARNDAGSAAAVADLEAVSLALDTVAEALRGAIRRTVSLSPSLQSSQRGVR